jgi:hypothetical protein
MKVSYSKNGLKWQIVFSEENSDPSGLTIAGNFNEWDHSSAKSTFRNGTKEVTVTLPAKVSFLSFKVFDNNHNYWREVYDNGELYAGLEQFFVRNELGTINIVVPLIDTPQKTAVKKPVVKKAAAPKTVKAPAKKTTK